MVVGSSPEDQRSLQFTPYVSAPVGPGAVLLSVNVRSDLSLLPPPSTFAVQPILDVLVVAFGR
jgi:hypothetical protein